MRAVFDRNVTDLRTWTTSSASRHDDIAELEGLGEIFIVEDIGNSPRWVGDNGHVKRIKQ